MSLEVTNEIVISANMLLCHLYIIKITRYIISLNTWHLLLILKV